jgi:hypothetical protein
VRITTTIGWHRPWLRHVIALACRELDYPVSRLAAASFSLCHNATYSGAAYLDCGIIRVKINPLNVYPIEAEPQRGLPLLAHADAVEVLVNITAHEVAHLERWDRTGRRQRASGVRDTLCERDTESLARMVLRSFQQQRSELLASWGDSGPGPVPPAVVHRLTCPRCGYVWMSARAPRGAKRRSCQACFPAWEQAAAQNAFLLYERIERTALT